MRRSALVPAVLLAVAFAPASVSVGQEGEVERLFDLGNEAYKEGRFADAAEAYREILDYRIQDYRVEYNLGNTAFKLDRLGEAILHYERAHRLAPTDPDVRANLDFARSMLTDRVEPREVAAPLALVLAVQDRLGPDRQAIAFLVLVWAIAATVAWCGARPKRWNATAGWAMTVLLVLALAVGTSWWTTDHRLASRRLAVVLADDVDVLSGPGENNAPLVTVHEGLTVRVRSERDEWLQVTLPDGLNGWLPADALGIV